MVFQPVQLRLTLPYAVTKLSLSNSLSRKFKF